MLPRDPASHSRHREHFEFLADQRQDFEQLAAAGAIDQLTVAEQQESPGPRTAFTALGYTCKGCWVQVRVAVRECLFRGLSAVEPGGDEDHLTVI
jgi:hypothetical protein